MRIHRVLVAAAAASIASQATAAILYEPAVMMVGDGTVTVAGQSRTTTIQIYQANIASQAAPVSQLAFNSGGSGTRLTNSDSAASEGMLSNNPGTADAAAAGTAYAGTVYTYSAGYDAPNGTDSIISSAVNANRVVGYTNVSNGVAGSNAIPFSQTQLAAYNGNSFRAATGDDNALNIWTAGTGNTASTAGWRYFNTNTQTSATVTNVRTTEIRNNRLFGTTGSGTSGLYTIGSPTPTNSGNTATVVIATGTSSPYEFVLIDDPNNPANTTNSFGYDSAYIADDANVSAAGAGGIQKWVWSGTAWSKAYILSESAVPGTTGNRGLAGALDASTGLVTLWTTTADGLHLDQVTDSGAGAAFTVLATAPTNNAFRGVALSEPPTVPEPTRLAVVSGLAVFAARRRPRRAAK
jgi:hypothetical protein